MLDNNNISGSKTVSRAAIIMCLTRSREEEREMKQQFAREDVRAAAVDYGGDFLQAITRVVERAVVAAKREGVISITEYREEGSVGRRDPRSSFAGDNQGHRAERRRQDWHRTLGQQRGGGRVFRHWPFAVQ